MHNAPPSSSLCKTPSILGGVLEQAPLEGAVAPPLRRELRDGIHERATIGRSDAIFDGDQDRANDIGYCL